MVVGLVLSFHFMFSLADFVRNRMLKDRLWRRYCDQMSYDSATGCLAIESTAAWRQRAVQMINRLRLDRTLG